MSTCDLCGSEIDTLQKGWKRLDGGGKVCRDCRDCRDCVKGGEEE